MIIKWEDEHNRLSTASSQEESSYNSSDHSGCHAGFQVRAMHMRGAQEDAETRWKGERGRRGMDSSPREHPSLPPVYLLQRAGKARNAWLLSAQSSHV